MSAAPVGGATGVVFDVSFAAVGAAAEGGVGFAAGGATGLTGCSAAGCWGMVWRPAEDLGLSLLSRLFGCVLQPSSAGLLSSQRGQMTLGSLACPVSPLCCRGFHREWGRRGVDRWWVISELHVNDNAFEVSFVSDCLPTVLAGFKGGTAGN